MKSKAIYTKKKVSNNWYNFRSIMEWHYAMYLDDSKKKGLIRDWEYEPTLFRFKVNKDNKVKAYLPDFKVLLPNGDIEYHETKGILTKRNTVALELMAKQYPKVKLIVIHYNSELYKSIRAKYRVSKNKNESNTLFWVAFIFLALYLFS